MCKELKALELFVLYWKGCLKEKDNTGNLGHKIRKFCNVIFPSALTNEGSGFSTSLLFSFVVVFYFGVLIGVILMGVNWPLYI